MKLNIQDEGDDVIDAIEHFGFYVTAEKDSAYRSFFQPVSWQSYRDSPLKARALEGR